MAHFRRVIAGLILAAAAVTIAAAPVPAAKIKHYVDPQQRFSLAIPPDAAIEKPRPEVALSLQSREGYAMRLQIGAAAPGLALSDMSRRMEARYLGASKVWSTKLGERVISVAGMQAYDALYEGTRTRTRVVIARGQRSDYVFMFFAPIEQFETFTPRFEFMLDSFRPAPGETAAKPPPPAETARQPAAKVAAPAPAPASRLPVSPASAQRFSDPAAGYSIAYPIDWMIDRQSTHTIIFSGKEGSHAYYATVSIQNTAPPQAKTVWPSGRCRSRRSQSPVLR